MASALVSGIQALQPRLIRQRTERRVQSAAAARASRWRRREATQHHAESNRRGGRLAVRLQRCRRGPRRGCSASSSFASSGRRAVERGFGGREEPAHGQKARTERPHHPRRHGSSLNTQGRKDSVRAVVHARTCLITLKPGVLDPAGKAVERSLHNPRFSRGPGRPHRQVRRARRRRERTAATAKARVEQMCSKLLANLVVESFKVEIQP